MEILIGLMAIGGILALGILLQTALLVFATSMAADRPLSGAQALVAVVGANMANFVVTIAMELTQPGISALYGLPFSLIVWGGVISIVGKMRIGQAVFSAIVMSVLQFVMSLLIMAAALTWLVGQLVG